MIGVSPIELNGMVSRTQDFSAIKHQDDVKPVVDQGNYQQQVSKNIENKATTVVEGQKTETDGEGTGSGGYAGDGGRQRKKKEIPDEGKMIIKRKGGFDISV